MKPMPYIRYTVITFLSGTAFALVVITFLTGDFRWLLGSLFTGLAAYILNTGCLGGTSIGDRINERMTGKAQKKYDALSEDQKDALADNVVRQVGSDTQPISFKKIKPYDDNGRD